MDIAVTKVDPFNTLLTTLVNETWERRKVTDDSYRIMMRARDNMINKLKAIFPGTTTIAQGSISYRLQTKYETSDRIQSDIDLMLKFENTGMSPLELRTYVNETLNANRFKAELKTICIATSFEGTKIDIAVFNDKNEIAFGDKWKHDNKERQVKSIRAFFANKPHLRPGFIYFKQMWKGITIKNHRNKKLVKMPTIVLLELYMKYYPVKEKRYGYAFTQLFSKIADMEEYLYNSGDQIPEQRITFMDYYRGLKEDLLNNEIRLFDPRIIKDLAQIVWGRALSAMAPKLFATELESVAASDTGSPSRLTIADSRGRFFPRCYPGSPYYRD